MTSVTIPNSVTSIGEAAFAWCSGLTSVTIPNSVTSIGDGAFYDCTGLTLVTVDDNNPNYCSEDNIIYTKGKTTLVYCMSSKKGEVTIPNSVTSIGNGAFDECSGLTSVTIPNSVTSIGNDAFRGCSGLTSVTIPNSVTSIRESAFAGCTGLTSVTIPNSVTAIGDYAFEVCSGLTSVSIGNSVTSIGYMAFQYCSGIKTISIGTGIKTICYEAFTSCKNIEKVTCYAENVPTMERDVFKDSYVSYATLKVPSVSVELYKSADQWKEFGTIQSIDSSEPTTKKCAKPSIAYEDNKLYFSTATPNANIVSEITDADVMKHYDSTVSLTATYNITAYATKNGYDNSDAATATLVWVTGSLTDGVNQAKTISVDALPLLITQDEGMVTISGLSDGDQITAYGTDGKQVAISKAAGNAALMNLSDLRGKFAILSVNGRSAKVVIK